MFFVKRRYDPNEPYAEDLLALDEKMCELLAEREQRSNQKSGVPPWEQLEAWGKRHGVDANWLYRVFHAMTVRTKPEMEPAVTEPGNLRTVIPIVKKAASQGCDITITHVMQYEKASRIFVEITHPDGQNVSIGHPRLQLSVLPGPYQVSPRGSRGGGGHFSMEFLVSPPIPDAFDELVFSLVKCDFPRFPDVPPLVLDQPVSFD